MHYTEILPVLSFCFAFLMTYGPKKIPTFICTDHSPRLRIAEAHVTEAIPKSQHQ